MSITSLYDELQSMNIRGGHFEPPNEMPNFVFRFYQMHETFDRLSICIPFGSSGKYFETLLKKKNEIVYNKEFDYEDTKCFTTASEIAEEIERIHSLLTLNIKNKKLHCVCNPDDTEVILFLDCAYRLQADIYGLDNLEKQYDLDKLYHDPNFINSNVGMKLTEIVKETFIYDHNLLWMGWVQKTKKWYGFDCIRNFEKLEQILKVKPFWKDDENIRIKKIVIVDFESHDISKTWGKALIGNSSLERYSYLKPCPYFRTDKQKIIGAPTEFIIEYDDNGKPIFNDVKENFAHMFAKMIAEQFMNTSEDIINEEVERRVEERIRSMPQATHIMEEHIPVAREVEQIE